MGILAVSVSVAPLSIDALRPVLVEAFAISFDARAD
jgi:hypothetical protein